MQITASPRPDTRPTFEVVLHARLQNLVSAPGEVVAPTTSTVRAVKTAVRGRRARCPGSSMKPSQDRASSVGNRVCHHVGFKCFAMSGRLVTLMSRIESHRTFQRDEADSISLAHKETCGLGRRGLFSCLEDPQENAFCYGSLLAPARSSSWDRGLRRQRLTVVTASPSGITRHLHGLRLARRRWPRPTVTGRSRGRTRRRARRPPETQPVSGR